MQNQTIDAIFRRRSCRRFSDRAVDRETAELLARAALAAPSGNNSQPVNVLILRNASIISELEKAIVACYRKTGEAKINKMLDSNNETIFYGASTLFILSVRDGREVDLGIAAENIVLAAESLDLANIHLGLPRVAFSDSEIGPYWKKKTGIQEGFEFGLAVAVGYAADSGRPHEVDLSKLSWLE